MSSILEDQNILEPVDFAEDFRNDYCEKVEVIYTIHDYFDDIKRYYLSLLYVNLGLRELVLMGLLFLYWVIFHPDPPNWIIVTISGGCLMCVILYILFAFLYSVMTSLIVMTVLADYYIFITAVVCSTFVAYIIIEACFGSPTPFYLLGIMIIVLFIISILVWLISHSHKITSLIKPLKLFDSRYYLKLVTTSSGKCLYLYINGIDRKVHYLLPPTKKLHMATFYSMWGNIERVTRSDNCGSGITINTFIDWINDDYMVILQNVENLQKNHFVREAFDYLAKTKSFDRVQNVIRSSALDVGGINWAGKLMFINELDEKTTIALKDFKNEVRSKVCVIKVCVYKVPLCNLQPTNLLFFHSFAVMYTEVEGTWWSCEKNTKYIVFQKNPDISKVRDYIAGDKRCANWYWKAPQLICEETVDRISMEDIVDICEGEMGITYQGISDNCHRFTDKLFNKCTGKPLDYGFLQKNVAKVSYWLASKQRN